MAILLPSILWAAHHQKHVIGFEISGNRFALVEFDGVEAMAVGGEELAQDARVFDTSVLENEDIHAGVALREESRSLPVRDGARNGEEWVARMRDRERGDGSKDSAGRTVHVRIEGRVQGVGYRAWTAATARDLGLAGYVRNRRDGSVEAVFYGPERVVEDMIDRCRRGPRDADVTLVTVVGEGVGAYERFDIMATD